MFLGKPRWPFLTFWSLWHSGRNDSQQQQLAFKWSKLLLAARPRKCKKCHRDMTRKRYFCLFILDFVILYSLVGINPLLTKHFFHKHATNHAPHFPLWPLYQSSILLQIIVWYIMNKKQPKYMEKVTFFVKFDREIFSPCVRAFNSNLCHVMKNLWNFQKNDFRFWLPFFVHRKNESRRNSDSPGTTGWALYNTYYQTLLSEIFRSFQLSKTSIWNSVAVNEILRRSTKCCPLDLMSEGILVLARRALSQC